MDRACPCRALAVGACGKRLSRRKKGPRHQLGLPHRLRGKAKNPQRRPRRPEPVSTHGPEDVRAASPAGSWGLRSHIQRREAVGRLGACGERKQRVRGDQEEAGQERGWKRRACRRGRCAHVAVQSSRPTARTAASASPFRALRGRSANLSGPPFVLRALSTEKPALGKCSINGTHYYLSDGHCNTTIRNLLFSP